MALARAEHRQSYDIDGHMKLLKQQVDEGIRDAESRQLAVQIVSANSYRYRTHPRTGKQYPVVTAWGREYEVPNGAPCKSRDEKCEIQRVWDFMQLNCRYVYDNRTIDQFATLRRTLEAGGGDCDDSTIAFATILGQLGYQVVGRVISVQDDPSEWVHVYPMVGVTKDELKGWIPLDTTVEGSYPGWEFPDKARYRDYQLV